MKDIIKFLDKKGYAYIKKYDKVVYNTKNGSTITIIDGKKQFYMIKETRDGSIIFKECKIKEQVIALI